MTTAELVLLLTKYARSNIKVTARGMEVVGVEYNPRSVNCDIKFEPYIERKPLFEDMILDWAEDNNVKHPELFAEHMKQYASEQLGLKLPQ